MRLRLLLFALCLSLAPVVAHASVYSWDLQFPFSNVSFTGTSYSLPTPATPADITTTSCNYYGPCDRVATSYNSGWSTFNFYAANSPTGTLNVGINPAGYFTLGTHTEFAGVLTITQIAATPEPSAVLMLGTGVLGLAGALRKRFA